MWLDGQRDWNPLLHLAHIGMQMLERTHALRNKGCATKLWPELGLAIPDLGAPHVGGLVEGVWAGGKGLVVVDGVQRVWAGCRTNTGTPWHTQGWAMGQTNGAIQGW